MGEASEGPRPARNEEEKQEPDAVPSPVFEEWPVTWFID